MPQFCGQTKRTSTIGGWYEYANKNECKIVYGMCAVVVVSKLVAVAIIEPWRV